MRWVKFSTLVLFLALSITFIVFWFDGPDPVPPSGSGELVKAIVHHEYGPPDVLRLEEIEKPVPNDNQILIKVRAASANPLDWHYMRGTPYLLRIENGGHKPQTIRLGVDVAGEVEAVGQKVTQFKPGDKVLGMARGAFAEYVKAPEKNLVLKPAALTYEQAAAIPIAALTALQGLRDKGRVKPGQKVLINGASGGVGTFAVQIAKSYGAEVTGVCSTRNVDLVRSLGADYVIDYTKEDFTKGDKRYDLILDNVGNQSLTAFMRVMTPKGTLVFVGGGGPDAGNWIAPFAGPLKSLFLSPFVDQNLVMLMSELKQEDLLILNGMFEAGTIKPVIDRTYPLSEVPEAIRYLETGRARGKVIITVEHDGKL